jgi:hypothetical protein
VQAQPAPWPAGVSLQLPSRIDRRRETGHWHSGIDVKRAFVCDREASKTIDLANTAIRIVKNDNRLIVGSKGCFGCLQRHTLLTGIRDREANDCHDRCSRRNSGD